MRCLPSLAVVAVLWCAAGCKPAPAPAPPAPTPSPVPSPSITPTPSPTPTPTPFVKRKPMDTGILFNGLQFKWSVETTPGDTAARDRTKDNSYRLELNLKIRTPRPADSLDDLKVANARLPQVLPSLPALLETAQVSSDYQRLYENKMDWLKERLERIDQILSRHNYYDCDTILELRHPETGRRALLVQGDMDVNVDGSDGDRNIEVDGSGQFFQPQTSYRWPKATDRPNPFIRKFQEKIDKANAELAKPDLSAARRGELQAEVSKNKRVISDLKSASFLVSKTDPTVVLPGFMIGGDGPKIGDYVVVVHEDKMYPAILGDAGPSYKVGEASLRLCNEINHTGTPMARPVNDLAVTYLVFPGSADPKRSAPDLERWHARCTELLAEIGVTNNAALHRWENIVQPWPTPTPSPTPAASPSEGPVVDTSGTMSAPAATDANSPTPGPSSTPLLLAPPVHTPTPSPLPSGQNLRSS